MANTLATAAALGAAALGASMLGGTKKRKPRKTKSKSTGKRTSKKTASSPKSTGIAPNQIIFNDLNTARKARKMRKTPANIYKLPNNVFYVGTYKGAMKHKRKGAPQKLGAVSGVTKVD